MRDVHRLAPELVELLSFVAQVCASHQGSVTSWFRSDKRNKAAGGHEKSKHLIGAALDVVYSNGRPPIAELTHDAEWYNVRVSRELTHDHFEARQLPLRMVV